MRSLSTLALALLLALPACDSSDPAQKDRGVRDTSGERSGTSDGPPADSGVDSRRDVSSPEVGPDSRVDLPVDRRDNGIDAPGDASVDAPAPDSTVDAPAPDSTVDAPAPDSSVDAPPPDSTADSSADSGVCSPTSCGALNCLGVACSCIKALHGNTYLRTDGTVVNFTSSSQQRVIETSPGVALSNVTEIFDGWRHGCALRADATVWCWPKGSTGNNSGELGNGAIGGTVTAWIATQVLLPPPPTGGQPTPLGGIKHINGGSSRCYLAYTTCAVRQSDGAVFCWGGDNAAGGAGSFFTKGSVGARAYATQLDASASAPLLGVDQISLGTRHACALKTDGSVWCWGMNVGGPLGQGDQTLRQYPTLVTHLGGGALRADQVGAGADATCIRDGAAVYCWGHNNSGQIGIGPPSDSSNHDGCINFCKLKPKRVVTAFPANTALTTVVHLNVGYLESCARLSDNSLWCWGAGGTNVASKQSIQSTPLDNNALWSSCSSGGLPSALRRLSRDNVLRDPVNVINQLCP